MKNLKWPALLALGILATSSTPSAGASSAGPVMVHQLAITLQIPKAVYAVGEPVQVRVILNNQSSVPLVIRFPAGQQYMLTIDTPAARVWSLSRHGQSAPIAQAIVIGPRQTLVFEETWNQRTAQGLVAAPGTYRLSGLFNGFVAPPASARPLQASVPQPGPLGGRAEGTGPGPLTPGVRLPVVQFIIRG